MLFPKELKYTKTHEWARVSGNKVTVGISDYAQKEISDVVFVELPKIGKDAQQAKAVAVIESVKAAFDIYAPVSGKVTRVNTDVETDPAKVNQDCYGAGWLFEIEIAKSSDLTALLDAAAYENHLKQESKSH